MEEDLRLYEKKNQRKKSNLVHRLPFFLYITNIFLLRDLHFDSITTYLQDVQDEVILRKYSTEKKNDWW